MRKKKAPEAPQLSREDLLRCELASARTEAALAATATQKLRLVQLRADCEAKIHAGEMHLATLQKHASECIRTAESIFGEMGAKHGVDFKRCSYDTETGVIHILPEDTKGGKD